jgi:DNA-binding HxlR family transcriptional regulator
VATPVGYQTFCPVGAALNVVGERWALLVVRDLLLGPRRYSELLSGLGGVGTDILAARLRMLQEHGVIQQVGEGRERRYELTEAGQELEPVLTALARWGAERLCMPSDLAEIPVRVPLTSLLLGPTSFPREAHGGYEIRVANEVVRVTVARGKLRPTPDANPDTTIELTRPGLRGLVLGSPVADLEASGDVSIHGGRRRGLALLNAVAAPPLLVELRPQLEPAGSS